MKALEGFRDISCPNPCDCWHVALEMKEARHRVRRRAPQHAAEGMSRNSDHPVRVDLDRVLGA